MSEYEVCSLTKIIYSSTSAIDPEVGETWLG